MTVTDTAGKPTLSGKHTEHTWVDTVINNVFAQKQKASRWRKTIIRLAFVVIWIILMLGLYPLDDWGQIFGDFFRDFLSIQLWNQKSPFITVLQFSFQTYLHPSVLRHLIALYASYWIAYRINAKYLADIFSTELEVTNRFIHQAAFGLSGSISAESSLPGLATQKRISNKGVNTIRIREGQVIEKDRASYVLKIGGPGYIEVELDSAVLVESPDGEFRIVGPTIKSEKEVLECFERVRQGVNLRDIIDSQNVSARSLEGIPVNVRDIQYSFSIYRGEFAQKNFKTPYPFDPDSVKRLVYRSVRSVQDSQTPENAADWQVSLPGKIASNIGGELAAFIATKGLSEFLAAIGEPELNKLVEGDKILDESPDSSAAADEREKIKSSFKLDAFTPRSWITNIFQAGTVFKTRLKNKGVQLNWIGVGTWDMPTEIITSNHLDAWKISRESYIRGNPQELDKIQREANLSELLRLVQTIPLNSFYNMQDKSDEEVISRLLAEYHEIMVSARKLYLQDGQAVPQELASAIMKVNSLRDVHWVNE